MRCAKSNIVCCIYLIMKTSFIVYCKFNLG
jgi:hypothetical protein